MLQAGGIDMASTLQIPALFTFNSPDEWPKWKRHFQQYHIASGLDKEGDEHQVSATILVKEKFTDVLQKFDKFFEVRKT